jgi:hypothetical protein
MDLQGMRYISRTAKVKLFITNRWDNPMRTLDEEDVRVALAALCESIL